MLVVWVRNCWLLFGLLVGLESVVSYDAKDIRGCWAGAASDSVGIFEAF